MLLIFYVSGERQPPINCQLVYCQLNNSDQKMRQVKYGIYFFGKPEDISQAN